MGLASPTNVEKDKRAEGTEQEHVNIEHQLCLTRFISRAFFKAVSTF